MAKVLFIVSGATYWVLKDGTRYATGYWAEEFANPYKILTDAGHEVVVATPNGVTRNLVTGQNPGSAAVLGKRMLEILAERSSKRSPRGRAPAPPERANLHT